MPIRFQCSACGAAFKAADDHAGQQLPCPKCGSALQVPIAQATLAPPDDPLDETENSGLAETQVNPLAGIAKKVDEKKRPAAAAPPPPPPPPPIKSALVEPPPNAFQSPQTAPEPRDLDLTRVKITDIDLPFWSIFRLSLKFWAVALLLTFALWLVMAVLAMVIGVGFTAIGP